MLATLARLLRRPHLQAARERDNRAALAAAAKRVVAADSSYITVDVARHDDGSYRLRAVGRLQRAAGLGGDVVTQLQLGTG